MAEYWKFMQQSKRLEIIRQKRKFIEFIERSAKRRISRYEKRIDYEPPNIIKKLKDKIDRIKNDSEIKKSIIEEQIRCLITPDIIDEIKQSSLFQQLEYINSYLQDGRVTINEKLYRLDMTGKQWRKAHKKYCKQLEYIAWCQNIIWKESKNLTRKQVQAKFVTDQYCINLLSKDNIIDKNQISPLMIKLKREQILMHRYRTKLRRLL